MSDADDTPDETSGGPNGATEGGDAAAEWEAMLAADEGKDAAADAAAGAPADASAAGGAAAGETAGETVGRVLNQDEIDSLLGFDAKGGDAGRQAGIFAILDKALMAYERLPMLEVVFDRMVRSLSTSLRNFLSDNVDVSIDSMSSLRFGDYLNSIPLPALLVAFKAVEWENFGLITVDGPLIYSVVDVLLGGRRSTRPVRIEGRPYTTIEQDLIKNMADIVLADMGAAFDPISPATFRFDRIETNPRFATIARPSNAALLVRLRIDMEDRGGILEILLPHATLEPIRDLLMQMFMGEKFGHDATWESHLGNELRATQVEVEAVLDQKTVTMGDVLNLRVGSTILLNTAPDDVITLRCEGTPVHHARLGRLGKQIAVQICDPKES